MDEQDPKEILKDAYNKAPAPIREYIDSGKLAEFTGYLKSRLSLSDDVMGGVSNEIALAILGMSDPSKFATNLRLVQETPADLVEPIVQEVNKAIFFPLRAKVKALVPDKPKASVRPAAVVPPAPPINRLAAPAAQKLLEKEEDAPKVKAPITVAAVKPVPPAPAVRPTPAPVVKPAAPIPTPAPKAPQIPPPPVKAASATAVPVPAEPKAPEAPAKKRPGEASNVPFTGPKPIHSSDPYREPVE